MEHRCPLNVPFLHTRTGANHIPCVSDVPVSTQSQRRERSHLTLGLGSPLGCWQMARGRQAGLPTPPQTCFTVICCPRGDRAQQGQSGE